MAIGGVLLENELVTRIPQISLSESRLSSGFWFNLKIFNSRDSTDFCLPKGIIAFPGVPFWDPKCQFLRVNRVNPWIWLKIGSGRLRRPEKMRFWGPKTSISKGKSVKSLIFGAPQARKNSVFLTPKSHFLRANHGFFLKSWDFLGF